MQLRYMLSMAGGVAMLVSAEVAHAQNAAPFTIRHPPDGATVREKVVVKVPLASIPEGAYVAVSLDGQFRVALSPSAAQRDPKKNTNPFFEYVWDTKAKIKTGLSGKESVPGDGPHTIAVELYPAGGTGKPAETSSVRVNVANKIIGDPGALKLRYKYVDRRDQKYARRSDAAILAGLSQGMQGSGEVELFGMKSDLSLSVQDLYDNGSAIVRNKMLNLSVRQGGTETKYPANQLPASLYQEVDDRGVVTYQNKSTTFNDFAQLGIPVQTTLELPLLPNQALTVGATWPSDKPVSLDIPGTAPEDQPKVVLTNKFEGIEWEGGYPSAKITQTFDSSTSPLKLTSITFGTIVVEKPTIKFTRDIFIAYRSGTLVKIARTIEVTGKTTNGVNALSGGGAPGMTGNMGGGMQGGMGGMMGMPPGMMGRGGAGGPSGPPAGAMGMMQMMGRGRGAAGGGAGGPSGPPAGAMGMMQMMGRGGAGAGGNARTRAMAGMMGGGPGGAPGMMGGGVPRMGGGPAGGAARVNNIITLKATSVTELVPNAPKTASR